MRLVAIRSKTLCRCCERIRSQKPWRTQQSRESTSTSATFPKVLYGTSCANQLSALPNIEVCHDGNCAQAVFTDNKAGWGGDALSGIAGPIRALAVVTGCSTGVV